MRTSPRVFKLTIIIWQRLGRDYHRANVYRRANVVKFKRLGEQRV